jgi:hypothetical protein
LSHGGTLWSWPGQNPFRWRDPSGRSGATFGDWFYADSGWAADAAPALATAALESDVPPLVAVGEAALLVLNVIDQVASLDVQRQSAAAIAKATSNDENECKKETGSYTNTHESGKTYSGKGGTDRSQQSGERLAEENDDPHTSTDWTPANDDRDAFKDESRRLDEQGGPADPSNYNKIESPGKKYRSQDGE